MSSPPNVEGPSPPGPAVPDSNAANDTTAAESAALAATSSDDVVAVATVSPRTAAVAKPLETAKAPSPLLRPIEQELLVMNRHVGRIIGRAGVTIRDIQLRSGAYLDVPQDGQPGETHRKIRISGSAEQVGAPPSHNPCPAPPSTPPPPPPRHRPPIPVQRADMDTYLWGRGTHTAPCATTGGVLQGAREAAASIDGPG